MKIIFLDIDGVLATAPCWYMKRDQKYNTYPFDKKAVKVLNKILKETNAEIVLSSDWRYYYNLNALKEIFIDMNNVIKAPIDVTNTNLPTNALCLEDERVIEINLWKEHNFEKLGVTHWVAIDDMDMKNGLINFVHCPRQMEGIKQIGVRDKIVKFLM